MFQTRNRVFDDTPEGRRRSVFFTLSVATGFISVVAATGALLASSGNVPVAAVLIILGASALGFASMTAFGRFGWLFRDG